MTFKLNGTTISNPSRFIIGRSWIERGERTASGKLVKDRICVKRRFELIYNDMAVSEITTLIALFELENTLTFQFPEEESTKTATVWFTEFPDPELVAIDPEEWENITVVLEEE
jgi:hypothetical protein